VVIFFQRQETTPDAEQSDKGEEMRVRFPQVAQTF